MEFRRLLFRSRSMHDDVFLIMNEGWVAAAKPRPAIEDKDRKLSETPDLEIGTGRNKTKYKMDLVPPAVVIARYFADDQARVDELAADTSEERRVGKRVVSTFMYRCSLSP